MPKLLLSVTGAHLLLEVLPAAPGAFGRILDSVFRARNPASKAATVGAKASRAWIASEVTPERLKQQLAEVFSPLQSILPAPMAGFELEVQLGLRFSHVGLLVIDGSASALTSGATKTYAKAWVRQMLHLDPDTQVIRGQVQSDPSKLLISCVDGQVFETLREFAESHDLRFVSCRPAVLAAMSQLESVDSEATILWTEAGSAHPRLGSVQLLQLQGQQVSATWRGWIPAQGEDSGSALEGAIRRFQNRYPSVGKLKLLHWPAIG